MRNRTARSRRGSAALNARTAVLIGVCTWRMRAGRYPWQSRRSARKRA